MNLGARDWNLPGIWRAPALKPELVLRSRGVQRWAKLFLGAALVAGLVTVEVQTSWLESHVFSVIATRATFFLGRGPAKVLPTAGDGPFDLRLGYRQLPELVARLEKRGFHVKAQAQASPTLLRLAHFGLSPLYHEKDKAGLVILDRNDRPLHASQFPSQVYESFDSIPPLVVNTLLFLEDREVLDGSHPYHNPAIQWDRLSWAVANLAIRQLDSDRPLIGGSTLATQLEKMRHSPGGLTHSVSDKARQLISASLRAYLDGPDTLRAQKEIILNYINSIPLAATRNHGEVTGLADGLREWYGADFATVNHLLSAKEQSLNPLELEARAQAYRQVLSLFLAMRAPSRNLTQVPDALAEKTDSYLRVLYRGGVISGLLSNLALGVQLHPGQHPQEAPTKDYVAGKASDDIRMALLPALGLDNAYALDRLDLTVRSTIDGRVQYSVARFLKSLSDSEITHAAGMDQHQLLDQGSPGGVIYSFTLFERGENANLLRVRTDNYNQPLDISQGTKLQLGSTAKLRTLINYLQIVEELHKQFAGLPEARLMEMRAAVSDPISRWALDYLASEPDRGLAAMLEAALQRTYSGSPAEQFFTAGGLHRFANFEHSEDGQAFTVGRGFEQSVNLVFIRLMRDMERYYRYRAPVASPSVLTDPRDPARIRYLQRFADYEGKTFLRQFYARYAGQNPSQALDALVSGIRLTPVRAAVIFRSIRPDAGIDEFSHFLRIYLPLPFLATVDIPKLFATYGPDKFDLNDRGYLAKVHPLELWLLAYRERHLDATLSEIFANSAAQRQDVYRWLFQSRDKRAQDQRIGTILEIDAFRQMHGAWQKLGYPFDSLVPSYATSIGVSGDTPQALADLVGVLVNGGVRYPSVRITQMHFAERTPLETVLVRQPDAGERVLSPEIAELVRHEMLGVVENGTGRRLQGGLKLADGEVLPIGGKTGTGDNRFEKFGPDGVLMSSRPVNRTAAFVFFIGDRFYGTVLAYVSGQQAANYDFTSALAVQVLKSLQPRLVPLMEVPGVQPVPAPVLNAKALD